MSGSSALRYHVLDVFTDTPLTGNPLAVVFGGESLSDARMQAIAAEFNLSETVFVLPATRPGALVRARIFTPTLELPFAGHPTVGTACLLADLGLAGEGEALDIVLDEKVGPVPVRIRKSADAPTYAELTTAVLPSFGEAPPAEVLADWLGLSVADLETDADAPRGASCGVPYNLVPLRSIEALGRARLQAHKLAGARPVWSSSFYLYAATHQYGVLRSRMFAPDLGVGEDPATGSAAVALCGHLADRSAADGELGWTLLQGVEMGRPSRLQITAEKRDGRIIAVKVGGQAVLIASGTLNL